MKFLKNKSRNNFLFGEEEISKVISLFDGVWNLDSPTLFQIANIYIEQFKYFNADEGNEILT